MPVPTVVDLACALLRNFEGLRLNAYVDPATGGEPITIGYGATGGFNLGDVWTREQAEADLAARVTKLVARVRPLLKRPCPDASVAALVSLAYNIGCTPCRNPPPGERECGVCNLARSSVVRLWNDGNEPGAADAFKLWKKADGKVNAALVKRRREEADAFRTGLLDRRPPAAVS